MGLLLQRLGGPLVTAQWGSTTNGNTTVNQFLQSGASTAAPSSAEASAQKPAGMGQKLWRLVGAISVAAAQQGTMTVRINGVSQATTDTVVGTAVGAVITNLGSPIAIVATDLLSILYKFGTADATATNPRAWTVSVLSTAF